MSMMPSARAGNPSKPHRHWAREAERWLVPVFSIFCSLASAHAVWWFFSALNWVDSLQWLVTILIAVTFTGLGFTISRGLAHRVQHKQKLGVVLFIAVVFELVEVGSCFAEAAVGILHIIWLPLFSGGLYHVLLMLCYVLLPVTPLFTLGLAWFEVGLDREKHGQEVLVGQPGQNVVPVTPNASAGGAPNVGLPAQQPVQQPGKIAYVFGGHPGGAPYNAGYTAQSNVAPPPYNSSQSNVAPPPYAPSQPYTASQPQANYPVMPPVEGQRGNQTIPFYQPGQPGPIPAPAQPPAAMAGRS